MRIFVICLLFVFGCAGLSKAQDTSLEPAPNYSKRDTTEAPADDLIIDDELVFSKVMFIPFEPKLYRSDFDPEMAKANRVHYSEIRYIFRHNLDVQLKKAAEKELHLPVSITGQTEEEEYYMGYIYKSIGYQ